MRRLTKEEEQILNELENPNLSQEEVEKKVKRLREINVEVTGGNTWLT